MLKKLKFNIEYIGSKFKKHRDYNLISLFKKKKLFKAKWAKGKKYYKEGYRVNA